MKAMQWIASDFWPWRPSDLAWRARPPTRTLSPVRGDCSAAAREALSENGGTLLSVEPVGNECVITILVQNSGERPKKKVVHKPM